jgi:hypothetical protein
VTFGKETGRRGARLGSDRIIELLANSVVPLALLYGRLFKNQALQRHAQNVYDALPASQDNTITRTIRKQLLRGTVLPTSASMQQGMIHLYKSYCTQNGCRGCDIGAACFPASTG